MPKKETLLYIHGKGGNAAESEHYKTLLPDCYVTGLDYRRSTPWETKAEFLHAYTKSAAASDGISIIANSIGAYFAMNAFQQVKIKRAFFVSPVVNMEKLITDMMAAACITPDELKSKKEIKTPFGETLSWEYFSYVKTHPIKWTFPTHILYGGKDMLTSKSTISAFAEKTGATLTVMENGEHWFHTAKQMQFLDNWLKEYFN